jgi:dihydropyrimidinase
VKTIIAGGTVVSSEGECQTDVLVDGVRIVAVGLDLPRDGAEVVDASGAYVIPGGIDVHTHFQMPFGGTVSCERFDTGTKAAATGGTTMVVDFALQAPGDTLMKTSTRTGEGWLTATWSWTTGFTWPSPSLTPTPWTRYRCWSMKA